MALDEASVCGRGRESGAESGEERLAERSRSETPPPSADGRTPPMRSGRIQIVTSTRFAQRNGRGREGNRADRKPVERANRVLVTTANRCSTRQRVVFPAALAFCHLALAAAEIRARPSALILRLFLLQVGHSSIATTRLYDKPKMRPEDSPTFKIHFRQK